MTRTYQQERYAVCREEDLAPGEVRLFTVGGRRLAVLRAEEGSYRAISDTCPHEGASMSRGAVEKMWTSDEVGRYCPAEERMVAICPWHNFEFDVETGLTPNVSPRLKIKTYRAEVEDGEVVVYV